MASNWFTYRGRRLRELDRGRGLGGIVEFDLDQASYEDLQAALRRFPAHAERAALDAVDSVRARIRAEITRRFKAGLTLTPAYITRGIKSRKARLKGSTVETSITVASRRFPIGRYKFTPETFRSTRGIRVSARQRLTYRLTTQGRQFDDTPNPSSVDHPAHSRLFWAPMSSGHVGVYYRAGEGRLAPIQQQYAPSLQFWMKKDWMTDGLQEMGAHRFRERFAQEMSLYTGGGR